MKKSVILGTASDPALRLVKVFTPALPKRFKAAGSVVSATISPSRAEPSNGHLRASSHSSATELLPRFDFIEDLSLSQLRIKTQQLKGEKAQVWGELSRYEHWYDGKGSMHARLKDIGSLCRRLREMADGTLETVRGEEELKSKLESGLRHVRKLLSQPLPTSSSLPSHPTASLSLHCFPISAVPAVISLSPTDGLVQAHLSNITYTLRTQTPYRGGDPYPYLSRLYLTYKKGGFRLIYDREYRQNEIRLVATVEGTRRNECIIGVKRAGEEVVIWVDDEEAFPGGLLIKLSQNRISLLPFTASNDLSMRHTLERHLIITESDGQVKLKWTTSLWNLGKRLYKARAMDSSSGLKLTGMTTDERLRTYKEFDVILGSGRVEIAGEQVAVSLHYNEILGLYRITIQREDWAWVMKEEDYRKDFAMLKELQFTYLQEEYKTLFASLELRKVLLSLLSPCE